MKKFTALFTAMLIGATAWAAGSDSVARLNAEVAGILHKFQNNLTVADLKFEDIRTTEDRALYVKLSGLYKKVGEQNTLQININNIEYNYGLGDAPATYIDAGIGFDLTKLIPQENLNELAGEVETLVKDAAKKALEEYGEAAVVDAKVTEKNQDAEGNYTSISAALNFKLDLAKLPEGKKAEDEVATEVTATLTLNVKTGVSINLAIYSNPGYKGFREDQTGLKEILDSLLNRDEKTMKDIEKYFTFIDAFAGQLVSGRE